MPQQRRQRQHKPPPRRECRFPGITRHAAELGVHRASLYRALTGAWDLPDLVTRYRALIAAERGN